MGDFLATVNGGWRLIAEAEAVAGGDPVLVAGCEGVEQAVAAADRAGADAHQRRLRRLAGEQRLQQGGGMGIGLEMLRQRRESRCRDMAESGLHILQGGQQIMRLLRIMVAGKDFVDAGIRMHAGMLG